MGLTQILDIATSSMRSTQEQINVTGENIAGVDDKYYIRKEARISPLVVGNKGSGTQVNVSTATVDQFIMRGLQERTSDFKSSDTWNNYYDKMVMTLGNPKNNINDPKTFTSINALLNGLFTSVNDLVQSPSVPTARQDFLNKTDQLISRVNDIAKTLQELRLNADKEIKEAVGSFNLLMDKLNTANIEGAIAAANKADTSYFDMAKYETVTKISELIDVKSITGDFGKIGLYTTSGISLLDSRAYHLKYNPINTIDTLIENGQISALEYYSISNQDVETYQGNLISDGQSASISTSLRGGKIHSLQQMRDVEIPKVLGILDNLSNKITYKLNAAHNSGASPTSPSSITGQTITNSLDERNYTGKFRVGIIDKNGNSVNFDSAQINGIPVSRPIKPLDIDLGSLDSGNGPGLLVSMQTIIDEINQYYFLNPTDNRVKIGGIEDVKLVSKQSNLTAGGTFDFDFEFDNYDAQNYNYEVMQISVNNSATGVTSTLPDNGIIDNFTRARTGNVNTISLAGGGGGNYTVTARIKVVDQNANTYVSDVSFVINDTQTGILNKRFAPISASGDNTILGTQGGIYIPSSTTQRIAQANIVDVNGQDVAPGEPGYLNIASMDKERYRIVIDDKVIDNYGNLDPSRELGSANSAATNKGFGHFMGLNNLLVDNYQVLGSSLNMRINPKVLNDSNNLATGKLKLTNKINDIFQQIGTNQARATFQLSAVPNAGDTISINNQVFTFVNGGATAGQIDVSSSSINTVIQNMVNTLSVNNSASDASGVNLLSFSQSTSNTLVITSNALGSIGNNFTVSANLSFAASLNSNVSSLTPSGTLIGGVDNNDIIAKTLPKFSVGKKSNDTIMSMVNLQNENIQFHPSGPITTVNQTLGQYATLFTSFVAKNAAIADQEFKQQENLINIYSDRFKESTGVNIQLQLSNLVKFQSIYIAQSKIVNTSNDLFKQLMNLI